ncbi:MAG: hypothetical protein K2N10_04060 [Muribaculaceae bacterium]|nr:hypothetical protein [Muribaculaceae bacterium]
MAKKSASYTAKSRRLVDLVRNDIISFLKSDMDLLRNEIDFQIHLGTHLLNSPNNYDRIYFEYRIPNEWLKDVYCWDSNLRIDIVVEKSGEYLPIELKYPTAAVKRPITCLNQDLSRKGEPLQPVLKHQGATDIVCYNFWKDVKRLELVKEKFNNINYGLAVLLTNDMKYLKHDGVGTCCQEFRISEGIGSKGPGTLNWHGDVKVAANRYPIELKGSYSIDWQDAKFDGEEFRYLILEIN